MPMFKDRLKTASFVLTALLAYLLFLVAIVLLSFGIVEGLQYVKPK